MDQLPEEWANQSQDLNVSLETILISIKILGEHMKHCKSNAPVLRFSFTASLAKLAHQCIKFSTTETMPETIINEMNCFLII
jgi:hypothetical protein